MSYPADLPPHGLMFHHFHGDGHHPSQGSISADELDALLNFVGPHNILPAEEWLSLATSDRLQRGQYCLTFDDSLGCQYDIALPVLESHGMTAFWFVYTSVLEGDLAVLEIYRKFRSVYFADIGQFYEAFFQQISQTEWAGTVERALASFVPEEYLAEHSFYTRDDRIFRYLRDIVLGPDGYQAIMASLIARFGIDMDTFAEGLWISPDGLRKLIDGGHVVGLHSHTHPMRLADLPKNEQREEYCHNRDMLARLLARTPVTMSHPCNSYGPETLAILEELGIILGFRSNMARLDGSRLEVPREDHSNIIRSMSR